MQLTPYLHFQFDQNEKQGKKLTHCAYKEIDQRVSNVPNSGKNPIFQVIKARIINNFMHGQSVQAERQYK